ncbi:aminoglycoside phosphotransferase family protein [Pseudonocardia petroleophila]|uniref:Aminoglycoside phosphotransferase family protein n=1 Tax=Pseudonocardia petroleophila TaxID=37331 RepID=A0A7G7MLS2_9PSEU|nr:aminoglycoside phosphotransferase family protein [Pseudonocardia petroleophila]QNG53733.1 aminoglycoside phosphotransferase family protein [Pseudonocardia petroleophila]
MAELATSSSEALTETTARRALTRACQQVGLPYSDAELIRIGSNAVFRVNAATIARVAPSVAHRENAQKQIDVARWLRDIDYPATRALDIEQPVDAEGRVVTFWESIAPETRYAPIHEVARLTRWLHDLEVPPTLALPALQPLGAPGDPFPDLAAIPKHDAQFLLERLEWARLRFPCLPFVLPSGVVHGDANVGNVLLDDKGRAVLIDLDGFSTGPREWDLIQTALFYDRLGWHTRDEYMEFVNVYGYDLMRWSYYGELADMREIAMTTWLCRKAGDSTSTAAEALKRVSAIRTGSSRHDWSAY